MKNINDSLEAFEKHKALNVDILYLYNFNDKKQKKVSLCAKYLFLEKYKHLHTQEELDKFIVYTCQDRFCPFCNWKKSAKLSRHLYLALDILRSEQKLNFLFLTLTIKNCDIKDFKKTIELLNSAFKKLMQLKKFKNSVKGYFRTLEFTMNKDNKTLHPHLHCILAVESKYFDIGYNLYIKQSEWQEIWQECLKIDYLPICNIKAVRPSKTKKTDNITENTDIKHTVVEIAKYCVKSNDLKDLSILDFESLYNQLFRKRTRMAGGVIKQAISKIKDTDDKQEIEDEELLKLIENIVYEFNFESRKYIKQTKNN